MGSETLKLPIIDFSDPELKPGTPLWDSLKVKVREALEEFGCFEASFSKIPRELSQSFIEGTKELFDLPLETKLKNVSDNPVHGYIGPGPEIPLCESMGIGDPSIPETVASFIRLMWPEGKPKLSKTIQSCSEQLAELDRLVRRMALESLGIEKYMDEHFNATHYLTRIMKYKAPQTDVPQIGQLSHTDKNMVSILFSNEPGLEVETKDGQWIKHVPSDTFVVMLGEVIHGWTNGRLHAPHHRVMMTGNEDRLSIGFFSMANLGSKYEVPKELVDEEHPLLFKPFGYSEFVAFAITDEARKQKHALKVFCGTEASKA